MSVDLSPLEDFCALHGLAFSAESAALFRGYFELLSRFRKGMNLIGPLSDREIVEELFLDSVVPAALRAPAGRLLDVGSGAGLPGLPLKFMFPDLQVTLVEPRRRRVTFLGIVIKRLGLEDIEVVEERIEALDLEPFDYVISKAFQPPLDWIQTASALTAPGGAVMCMTREDQRDALIARAPEVGLREPTWLPTPVRTHDGVQDRIVGLFERVGAEEA